MQYTAQVNGSTKILVTVVASQELEAGDVLRRFKAEVSQDEPLRGNNTDRFILGLLGLGVWKLLLFRVFFIIVLGVFFLFDRACVDNSLSVYWGVCYFSCYVLHFCTRYGECCICLLGT